MIAIMISDKPAKELIRQLDLTDETEDIEAKRGSEVGRAILETICSLSNEPDLGGGTILLGVEKDENSLFPLFTATGISDVDKVVSDLSSQSASVFNVPVRIDVTQEVVAGRCVIRVDVPELPRDQKPLYFKAQGLPAGAFRRIGSSDVRCTHDDLYAFFQMRAQEPPDRHIVEDATWDDIDPVAIDTYRRARAEANPLAEELNWTDLELLHALNGVVRHGDEVQITITGLIAFGKAAALRRISPSHRIDYIRVAGKTWVQDFDDTFESVSMRGPLMRTIGRVIASILDDLPKTFRFDEGKAQRTDVPLVPERVIREAVVNAVAHRSYQAFNPIQIIRYSNRIEIRNPGYSLKSQERFAEPGSTLRNPHIAEILHETRFAETKGSGIRVMRQKMAEMGLAEPT
jgi:ATP-dependent DNA helicase RecG